jgi:predicted TIM-barrel fold metal-dependent hydrolase
MSYLVQRDTPSTPRLALPELACDCHAHIFGASDAYPFAAVRDYTPPPAPVRQYLAMLATTGLHRAVIVQPSVYGQDNRCTLDAVADIGLDRARAVVAVPVTATRASLVALHRQGARGVRFMHAENDTTFLDNMKILAVQLADLGMHVQLYVRPAVWRQLLPTLHGAGVDVVLDHIAGLTADRQSERDDIDALRIALDGGLTWVKLSQCRGSLTNHPYRDTTPLAAEIAAHAPERCVWGTDWPHPNSTGHMPDDGELVDLIADWAPDPVLRQRIMVDNAARLYGFEPAP